MSTSEKPQDTQIGGDHYQMCIQPIDYIMKNKLSYPVGNVIKYVSRYKNKNGLQDLIKAKHYIDFIIAEEYPEQGSPDMLVQVAKVNESISAIQEEYPDEK